MSKAIADESLDNAMVNVPERRKGMSEQSISDTAEDRVINNSIMETESNDIDSIDEYTFDDYYLDSFLAGNSKAESYRRACNATGYEIPAQYLNQYAYAFHKRLDSKGALQQALQRHVQSDQIKSRLKLLSLMETAQSEQVQFSSAKHVSGTLYSGDTASSGIQVTVNRDSVTIKHKDSTLTVENNKEISEID